MRLLSPVQIGPLRLPNRVAMAPLTRNRAPGTVPGELMATHYAQRASAGLIVAEATQVGPAGQSYPNTPGIHSPEQVRGWRRVTDAIRAAGGRVFLQIFHGGRISHPSLIGTTPVAPSALTPEGRIATPDGKQAFVAPRALATEEILGIIADFRRAAENALEAGFHGVEVHGANGYLLDQFLQSGTNHRSDAYGGSAANRARLLVEVAEAVAAVWGNDRVGVRLSPGGTFNGMSDDDPIETFTHAARALAPLNLAYLHVIEPAQSDQLGERDGGPFPASALVRDAVGGNTVISAGGYDRDGAEAALLAGAADLIAFGRLYIANPDLVERFARGAPKLAPRTAQRLLSLEVGFDMRSEVQVPQSSAGSSKPSRGHRAGG